MGEPQICIHEYLIDVVPRDPADQATNPKALQMLRELLAPDGFFNPLVLTYAPKSFRPLSAILVHLGVKLCRAKDSKSFIDA
jgi:hypothetical protein